MEFTASGARGRNNEEMLARFLKNCESIVSQGVVYTVFSSCMWSSHVTGFSVDPPLTAHRLQVYV